MIGLGLVALLISYLPSIYGAFARRERMVGLLEGRAGSPPTAVAMLTRYAQIGALGMVDDELFQRWEEWFIDVEESHTSFAALVFFRSPQPERSWITAAGLCARHRGDHPARPSTALEAHRRSSCSGRGSSASAGSPTTSASATTPTLGRTIRSR